MKQPKILVIALVVFSVMLSSFLFYFFQIIYATNINVQADFPREFIIPTGATFKDVQKKLYHKKYVNDLVSFSFLAKIMNYYENIKPGLYLFQPNMNNVDAIRLLRSGIQTPVNITFNNIRLLSELPKKITRNLEMSEEDFYNLIYNDSIREVLGFDSLNFISMFVPNTYESFWDTKPAELLNRMKFEYDKFWNDERMKKAANIGLSKKEVAVLASIVQAETTKSDEKPRIAGVYFNRLKKGIPLQADPTLIFAMQDFTIKRVLNMHKNIESPYNTYKYRGLPPGPIKMPSTNSIDAVLNYEEHKYIYFCAKEDFSGYHNFATNLMTHKKNAIKYRRALDKTGLYR